MTWRLMAGLPAAKAGITGVGNWKVGGFPVPLPRGKASGMDPSAGCLAAGIIRKVTARSPAQCGAAGSARSR